MKNSPRRPFNSSGGSSRNNRPFVPNKDQMMDSSGPAGKIRGTPQQVMEKYMNLGRDTLSSGDYVMAESFFQHAEHYRRFITTKREERLEREQQASHQNRRVPTEEAPEVLERTTSEAAAESLKVPENPPKIESEHPIESTTRGGKEREAEQNQLPAFLNPRRPRVTITKTHPSPGSSGEEGVPDETQKKPRRRITRPKSTESDTLKEE